MTDGNGNYGIFAPASAGLSSVAKTEDIKGTDWTKMTLDLTDSSIADGASVAVYEHNGLTNVYGEPYTSMTWGGDTGIKHLTIAGMYDYQRSPTLGWDHWGTMFTDINEAGNSTVVNGYGIALIRGDTVGGLGHTDEREIRNMSISFGGIEYTGTFESAQVPEPASLALLAMSGLALLLRRRRK